MTEFKKIAARLRTEFNAIRAKFGQPNGLATLDSTGKVPTGQIPASTSTPSSPGKRQTVLDGPVGPGGNADFLRAAGPLSVDILGAAKPIKISFAAGSDDNGNIDHIGKITTDMNIGSLVDNATNYIFGHRNSADGVITPESSIYPQSWRRTKPFGYALTARTSGFGASDIYGVCHSGTLFCAVGAGGKISTSPDGVTWTPQTSGTTNEFNEVAFGNGIFVAVGSKSTTGQIRTSTDGITWVDRSPVSGTPYTFYDVKWFPWLNLFIVVGGNGYIYTSPDGITWTLQTSGTAQGLTSVAISQELGIAVVTGDNNTILSSTNGTTWIARPSAFPGAQHCSEVGFGNGRFVISERYTYKYFQVSEDGINWKLSPEIKQSSEADYKVIYSDLTDQFIVVGESGTIHVSDNGGDFQIDGYGVGPTNFYGGCVAVAGNPLIIVLVGSGGTIMSGGVKNGLRWYDRLRGQMHKLGTAGWIERQDVALGDITFSSGLVTDICSYAYNRCYDSVWIRVASSSSYYLYHNLGIRPDEIGALPKLYISKVNEIPGTYAIPWPDRYHNSVNSVFGPYLNSAQELFTRRYFHFYVADYIAYAFGDSISSGFARLVLEGT